MKLKVLGTQSPWTTENHYCPGFLVTNGRNNILLDCGNGTHKMVQIPKIMENLYIITSHLDDDHYGDITVYQDASYCLHNQKRLAYPITICTPTTPIDKSKLIRSREYAFAKYININNEASLNIGDINVSFCRTIHPTENYAIKLEEQEKTIVYTGDTSFESKDKLIDFAKGANLLISESSLLVEHGFPEITSHLTAKQAAIIAKEADVKQLMLTHFWPEENVTKYVEEAKSIFPNTIPALEGNEIDFPSKIKEENIR